jgi:hypothetical protein
MFSTDVAIKEAQYSAPTELREPFGEPGVYKYSVPPGLVLARRNRAKKTRTWKLAPKNTESGTETGRLFRQAPKHARPKSLLLNFRSFRLFKKRRINFAVDSNRLDSC